ncbi:MAG TPA: hypothetical protein VEY70_24920 [Metabacillus sp.]|nr:hypothetical protein [Metabacillus sp.]
MTSVISDSRDTKFNYSRFADAGVAFGLGVSVTSGTAYYLLTTEQAAQAVVPPEVQAVVTNTTDTLPVLTGICLAVFSAGLAPWAARTTLSWLSSIMKGAI